MQPEYAIVASSDCQMVAGWLLDGRWMATLCAIGVNFLVTGKAGLCFSPVTANNNNNKQTTKRVGTHISPDGRGFDAVWERTFRRALRLALGTHISCEGENAHFAGRAGGG